MVACCLRFFLSTVLAVAVSGVDKICSRNDIFKPSNNKIINRPGCTVFDSTGNLHQNGYDSLLAVLSDTMNMDSIQLGYQTLGDAGFLSLAEELKQNTTLTKLFLHLNDAKDDGVAAIASALMASTHVTVLSVHTNDIGAPGAKALSELLIANPTSGLERLHIGDNHIGEEGGLEFARALKVNRHLKHLYLFKDALGLNNSKSIAEAMTDGEFPSGTVSNFYVIGNNINDKGTKVLAEALAVNDVLTHLDLGKNVIRNPGALDLANALKSNSSAIVTLALGWNQIRDLGAYDLGEMLKVNTKLRCLDLSANWIQWQGAQAIALALNVSGNTALKYLDLSSNYIDTASHPMLREHFRRTHVEHVFLDTFPDGDYVCRKLQYCGIEDADMHEMCVAKGFSMT